jgi:hypothetical protein
MLDKEFKYYLDHQKELVVQYNNKFLVIVGDKVVGAYDTNIEAYNSAKKEFEPGTFLVQKCTEGKADYTSTFYSRVSFS